MIEDTLLFYVTAYLMFAGVIFTIIIAAAVINYQFKRTIHFNISFLHNQIKKIMEVTKEQFRSLMQRIDASTNDLSAEVKSLRDKIKGQGLDPQVEEELFAGFSAIADKLEGIGKEEIPPATSEGGSGTTTGGTEDAGEVVSGPPTV